ncbi:class I SAM-dependent methyltransferase [Nisaea sp.]|uniref:class I SAM-dependent methyltransferase n=1 Tax=Nisaea sp. TaxID=2024842 RepID=UPI0032EF6637
MSAPLPTTSAYIRTLQSETESATAKTQRIRHTIEQCWSLEPDRIPPRHLMNVVGSPDAAHFRATMCDLFGELALRGAVEPTDTVLDLGCGCGRLAIPFAAHLGSGTYIGVDVWTEGLDWCRDNIASDTGSLQFIHREAVNNYYFEPRAPNADNHYHLSELDREQVDFAFAISLFTHLQQRDCFAYLSELSRVLKGSGCAYITCFIIDEFFFDFVRRTGLHRAVSQEQPGCYYAYEGQDFFAGYTRATWTGMLENSGLKIVGYDPGTWAEKPGGLHYQDTFMVVPQGYRKK